MGSVDDPADEGDDAVLRRYVTTRLGEAAPQVAEGVLHVDHEQCRLGAAEQALGVGHRALLGVGSRDHI